MVSVRELLTRGYAWFGLGGVCNSEHYRSRGIEATVYWVDTDDWIAGQYTPWGTILLNKHELRDRSESLTEFTFLHEVGHGQMPLFAKVLLTPLRFMLMVALIALPFAAPVYFARVGTTADLLTVIGAYVVLCVLVVGTYVTVSWIDEGYSELFVLSKIGPTNYRNCHHEARKTSDSGLLKAIWHRLTYPRPEVVLWVYNRLDRLS